MTTAADAVAKDDPANAASVDVAIRLLGCSAIQEETLASNLADDRTSRRRIVAEVESSGWRSPLLERFRSTAPGTKRCKEQRRYDVEPPLAVLLADLDGHQRITIPLHNLIATVAAMMPNVPT